MTGKHIKLTGLLALLVLFMFAFGFALVPLYNSICRALSINGKPSLERVAYDKDQKINRDREVLVQFIATNNGTLPWEFYTKTHEVRVHPGEMAKLYFYAENKSETKMTVQAIPSVTPGLAAKYIKKTECFCFTQQSLGPHEAMDMPVIFHLDLDIPLHMKTITIAYTLFDVSDKFR